MPAATLLTRHADLGHEVWYRIEDEMYCLYASANCDDPIGEADTLAEAREVARWWFNDLQCR